MLTTYSGYKEQILNVPCCLLQPEFTVYDSINNLINLIIERINEFKVKYKMSLSCLFPFICVVVVVFISKDRPNQVTMQFSICYFLNETTE